MVIAGVLMKAAVKVWEGWREMLKIGAARQEEAAAAASKEIAK
jgi:hypothetical protein